MQSEAALLRERVQIVEAMDWIDAERKRLSRYCFSETRKKWHGEKERGRRITLMKKQGEWLYRRRCRLRERIGQVNTALKELRRARSGRAGEGFGSAFVEAARETLPEEFFANLMEEATRRLGDLAPEALAAPEAEAEEGGETVLDLLKRDMEEFLTSNEREPTKHRRGHHRESQTDFGIDRARDNARIFPALAWEPGR